MIWRVLEKPLITQKCIAKKKSLKKFKFTLENIHLWGGEGNKGGTEEQKRHETLKNNLNGRHKSSYINSNIKYEN